MPIERMTAAARDYIRTFGDLKCVAVSPSGRVYVTDNPAGAATAWWCKAADADQIGKQAWPRADVVETARALSIAITPHAALLKRVAERTAKIEAEIANAIDNGTLKAFNKEYRLTAAQWAGYKFMPYPVALAKLRRVVIRCVASGDKIFPQSFINEVFEAEERVE